MGVKVSKLRYSLTALYLSLMTLGVTLVLTLSAPLAHNAQSVAASAPVFDLATKMGISTSTAAVAVDIIAGASWIGTAVSIALAASGVGLIGAGTFAIIKGIIKNKGKSVAIGW